MSKTKVAGYGRYKDDPDYVGCPRAKSDMTPCIARDGHLALDDTGECVGCGATPRKLTHELVTELGTRSITIERGRRESADQLRDLVREVTE